MFHIDNWAQKSDAMMVQSEAAAAPALAHVRAQGSNPDLYQFVDTDGLLCYTGAAGECDQLEVTGGRKVNTIKVNTRSMYTPQKDTVGNGTTAPSDAECNMAMVKATLAKVLNDAEMLLGWCSSSMAREVRTAPPLTHRPRPDPKPSPALPRRTPAPWHCSLC